MAITRGVIAKAQKVVIYGPEGIGKSTLASKFPDPVFIDIEGSTNNMDVAREDKPSSWTMLMQTIERYKQTVPCKTLIIDTADWAERLCTEYVLSSANKTSITQFGYGEGFIKLEEEYGRFLNKLSDLIENGINVILTAHAKIVKFEQPDEMGAYDRWELKLGNKTTAKTAPLTKEWSDAVLFCNYKTLSVAADDKGKKFKGQGGKRVIYTNHHPAWDAKNRWGLPDEIPLDYSQIAHIFQAPVTSQTQSKQPVETVQQPQKPIQSAVNQIVEAQTEKGAEATQEELFNANTPPLPKTDQNFERPPVMDDLTGIHPALVDLMELHNVQPIEIQQAVSSKGYYPIDTPIVNYDEGFIQGVLVGAWDQVFQMIQDLREKQAF